LDQGADDMLATGGGGMRQTHHYVGIEQMDKIETPPEDYRPDTIGEVSMEQLQQQRNNDVHNK